MTTSSTSLQWDLPIPILRACVVTGGTGVTTQPFLSIIRRSTTWSRVWMGRWCGPTEPTKTWVSVAPEGWLCTYRCFKTSFIRCSLSAALPGTSGQAVCKRDRPAGRSSGRGLHHPQWCESPNGRTVARCGKIHLFGESCEGSITSCAASASPLCIRSTGGPRLTRTLGKLSFRHLHLFSVTASVGVQRSGVVPR